MNRIRRKTLQEIFDTIAEARDLLEEAMNEEEDYRDNMPENLQGSERYEKADEACDNLSEAVSSLEDVLDYIEAAME